MYPNWNCNRAQIGRCSALNWVAPLYHRCMAMCGNAMHYTYEFMVMPAQCTLHSLTRMKSRDQMQSAFRQKWEKWTFFNCILKWFMRNDVRHSDRFNALDSVQRLETVSCIGTTARWVGLFLQSQKFNLRSCFSVAFVRSVLVQRTKFMHWIWPRLTVSTY